jgi:hypothetical protein
MSAKNSLPGFTAEASLYKTSGRYQGSRHSAGSAGQLVIPAIPACRNCDYILDRCERNGWRPRALCNACAVGNCYVEPPPPNPFPDPFPPLPRF